MGHSFIKQKEVGICGLSCKLCPNFQSTSKSKCYGCKSEDRIKVGCPFITCAVKSKGIEFCWECKEHLTCNRWKAHREFGKCFDTFKCYQALERDINTVKTKGLDYFINEQNEREKILKTMLSEYNEGRSKSYYCIACTVMSLQELEDILSEIKTLSEGLNLIERSKMLHSLLDKKAKEKNYLLKLRKSSPTANP